MELKPAKIKLFTNTFPAQFAKVCWRMIYTPKKYPYICPWTLSVLLFIITLSEGCSHLRRQFVSRNRYINVHGQISVHILVPDGSYCLFIAILRKLLASWNKYLCIEHNPTCIVLIMIIMNNLYWVMDIWNSYYSLWTNGIFRFECSTVNFPLTDTLIFPVHSSSVVNLPSEWFCAFY